MKKEELRKILLDLNIFDDNEYFDQYCDTIINNLNRKRERLRTQLHHIIPRSYFKQKNLEIDNSSNNLVNLLYVDHVKCHCYLSLCAKEDKFKHSMMVAIYKIMGSKYIDNKKLLNDVILNSEIYQKAYENSRLEASKFNPMNIEESLIKHNETMRTEEVRNKISNSMKLSRKLSDKQIHVYKGRESKRISAEELKTYLDNGWKRGNPKGMKYIHKGEVDKKVWPEELDKFLQDGWELGRYRTVKVVDENKQEKKIRRLPKDWGKVKPKGFNKSQEFRDAQRERLNNYYKNNPDFKTRSKKAVLIFNDVTEYKFNSIKEAERFLGIQPGKGYLSYSFKLGYIDFRDCIYNGWKIKKGDNIDEL